MLSTRRSSASTPCAAPTLRWCSSCRMLGQVSTSPLRRTPARRMLCRCTRRFRISLGNTTRLRRLSLDVSVGEGWEGVYVCMCVCRHCILCMYCMYMFVCMYMYLWINVLYWMYFYCSSFLAYIMSFSYLCMYVFMYNIHLRRRKFYYRDLKFMYVQYLQYFVHSHETLLVIQMWATRAGRRWCHSSWTPGRPHRLRSPTPCGRSSDKACSSSRMDDMTWHGKKKYWMLYRTII